MRHTEPQERTGWTPPQRKSRFVDGLMRSVKRVALSSQNIRVVVLGSGNAAGIYVQSIRGRVVEQRCTTRRKNSAPFHSAVLPSRKGEPLGNPLTIPFRENSKREQMFDVERKERQFPTSFPSCWQVGNAKRLSTCQSCGKRLSFGCVP